MGVGIDDRIGLVHLASLHEMQFEYRTYCHMVDTTRGKALIHDIAKEAMF